MTSEWIQLELISKKLKDHQVRMDQARARSNYGLVYVLEQQIADAERQRAQLLTLITTQITYSPETAEAEALTEPTTTETEISVGQRSYPEPVQAEPLMQVDSEPISLLQLNNHSGADHVEHPEQHEVADTLALSETTTGISDQNAGLWEMRREEIEHVAKKIGRHRSETLARHALELTALESDEAELTALENALVSFSRRLATGT